jgi:hypothetical protein
VWELTQANTRWYIGRRSVVESAWHPRGFPRWVPSSLEKVKRFSAVSPRGNDATNIAAIRPAESVSFREFVWGL